MAVLSTMTTPSNSIESARLPWSGRHSGWCLAGILLVSLLVRLPFRATGIFHCDSFGYCMGGLGDPARLRDVAEFAAMYERSLDREPVAAVPT
jgi:hypothetical protein